MFLDNVEIEVQAGNGGDGMSHFHREKYVNQGGPDGGDGGHGGSVFLRVEKTLNTLYSFRRKRSFDAQNGQKGTTNNRTGKSGEDLFILVPPGTMVRESESGLLIGDLTEPEQVLRVARGGRGGRGNPHFASASNQAPTVAERGAPGDHLRLRLELKLIADIGLVGAPNAGKSTLLAAVTAAHPKIAPYPFTTTEPNLGVAMVGEFDTIVLADIPGLIEGAHLGVGLGVTFLRHVQRTRVLIHVLDGAASDPIADFSQTNSEIALFDPELGKKPQLVAVNKMDIPEAKARWEGLRGELQKRGYEVFAVSAATHEGTREVILRAAQLLRELPSIPLAERELPIYRAPEDVNAFSIDQEPDGYWRVKGKRIERAARMTYWENDEAVERFQRILAMLGIYDALREAGVQQGDMVRIGENELEWHD